MEILFITEKIILSSKGNIHNETEISSGMDCFHHMKLSRLIRYIYLQKKSDTLLTLYVPG
jgi:hypothetical protein